MELSTLMTLLLAGFAIAALAGAAVLSLTAFARRRSSQEPLCLLEWRNPELSLSGEQGAWQVKMRWELRNGGSIDATDVSASLSLRIDGADRSVFWQEIKGPSALHPKGLHAFELVVDGASLGPRGADAAPFSAEAIAKAKPVLQRGLLTRLMLKPARVSHAASWTGNLPAESIAKGEASVSHAHSSLFQQPRPARA